MDIDMDIDIDIDIDKDMNIEKYINICIDKYNIICTNTNIVIDTYIDIYNLNTDASTVNSVHACYKYNGKSIFYFLKGWPIL